MANEVVAKWKLLIIMSSTSPLAESSSIASKFNLNIAEPSGPSLSVVCHVASLARHSTRFVQQVSNKEDKQKTPYKAPWYPLATRKRARYAKHAMRGRTGRRRRLQIKCDFLANIFGPVKSLNNFAVRTSFRFISKSNFRLFRLPRYSLRPCQGPCMPWPKEFAFLRPDPSDLATGNFVVYW